MGKRYSGFVADILGVFSDYNGPILRLCEQHFFMNEKKHMGYIPFSIAFQQALQKLTIFSAWTRMYQYNYIKNACLLYSHRNN